MAVERNRNINSHDITKIFADLGEKIQRQWVRYNYSEDALATIAANILNITSLHKLINPEQILNLALSTNPYLSAYQVDSPFGDLQQIIYRHAKFYIELLYWCEGITTIHDHAFSGAFSVLHGSSINVEYQFDLKERINHHFSFGSLKAESISKLEPGSVEPIYSGTRFIHSVFHLENPTLSVVVRTYKDNNALPQYDYRGKHIRLVQDFVPEFAKKLQALRFIEQQNIKNFFCCFENVYHESSIDERYWLLRAFYTTFVREVRLEHMLSAFPDEKTFLILEAIEEEALLHKTMQIRQQTDDPEIRYLLAILLNIPNWHDIEKFINTYHGQEAKKIINKILMHFNIDKKINLAVDIAQVSNIVANKRYKPLYITSENAINYLVAKKK